MKNKLIIKELVLGIIMLFVGTGVVPTSSTDTATKTNDINALYYSDPPVVTITIPGGGWTRGFQWVNGTANDPDGTVVLVQVAITEEGLVVEEDDWVNASGTTNWSYLWDTFGYGEFFILWNISVRAKDNDGNWGYATSKTVEVDNTPPIIIILMPMEHTITINGHNWGYIYNKNITIAIGPFKGVPVKVYATDPHHGQECIVDSSVIFHWADFVFTLLWGSGSWDFAWNVPRYGRFRIYAECEDKAGNHAETNHYDVLYFNI